MQKITKTEALKDGGSIELYIGDLVFTACRELGKQPKLIKGTTKSFTSDADIITPFNPVFQEITELIGHAQLDQEHPKFASPSISSGDLDNAAKILIEIEKLLQAPLKAQFVPYEDAIMLKNLGFDELCFGYYVTVDEESADLYLGQHPTRLKAPTYQQACDWIEKTFDLYCPGITRNLFTPTNTYSYCYNNLYHKEDIVLIGDRHKSREGAQLEMLRKLLSLALRKSLGIEPKPLYS